MIDEMNEVMPRKNRGKTNIIITSHVMLILLKSLISMRKVNMAGSPKVIVVNQ